MGGEIIGLGTSCTKHVDCKDIKETEGANLGINKLTREICEDVNDGKRKQIK